MNQVDRSSEPDAFELSRSEVRGRALAGVVYVTASGFVSLMIAFVGNLALARMLVPHDFGVVAIGMTVTLVAGALAEGGLGAGMVRRPEPPTRKELRALNGIQLAISLAIVIPTCLVALQFGDVGAVTVIIVASLPIDMLQTPGRVLLTRAMRYDRQALIDVCGNASFYAFAVTTVALGANVWGYAAATIARSAVSACLSAVLTIGFLAPSLRGWREERALVGFGIRFQATWLIQVLREQGVNAVTALVAGLHTVGLWTLASRLMRFPTLAFQSLYTVGFPAMANLLARGDDPRPVILRVVRRAAVGATLVFPAFAAASPELVPALFGEPWRDAAAAIPFTALSILIVSSISVGASSYLNAAGRPGIVAAGAGALGVAWIGVTAVLLSFVGVAAIGIGSLCGGLLEAFILDRATKRAVGAAPYRPLVRPLAVALFAGTTGWLVCYSRPSSFAVAVLAGILALGLSIIGLRVVCREDLRDALSLATQALGKTMPRLRRWIAEAVG
jgi:O-antigen/teichoic acid export membrane protein